MNSKNAILSTVTVLMLLGLSVFAVDSANTYPAKAVNARYSYYRLGRHHRHHRRHHKHAGAQGAKTVDAEAWTFDNERKQIGAKVGKKQVPNQERSLIQQDHVKEPGDMGPPKLAKIQRAGRTFDGDIRDLPRTPPVALERREPEEPFIQPRQLTNGQPSQEQPATSSLAPPDILAPAPAPNAVFEGLDRFNWGAGSPPDTNGDVGPLYYIQTVNTSIGVYNKNTGAQVAAFTFNTFMSQGTFGNLCDTNNFGDPVVLYDSFEDRWIISDFAFILDGSGNVVAPAFQCFAASKSGDPVSGGWNFYSIQITDNLDDYPKLGIWPDGMYMSANLFSFGAGSAFKAARLWAFNKSQMYAGSPTVQSVSFDVSSGDFTIIPSNARLQTGTPPAGTPNYFVSTSSFLNALSVYKFNVNWNHLLQSTLTGPSTPLASTSWPNAAVAAVPQSGTTQTLDSLSTRAMVQNQYTNLSAAESLWITHTVRRFNTGGSAAPRWYQVNVTGGTIAASLPQATTWDPDGNNTVHRWMPSVAVDRAGDMAMGYSTSSSSTFPSIKYAGRLAADPINTFSLTEQTFFTGTASQLSSNRWGDYSSMTLDPNGCTFWYTTEYATGLDNTTVDPTSFNKRWKTKFGNFGPFPGCTNVGSGGVVSGTVTTNPGGTPINGATVSLGNRTTTTDVSGNYSFAVPAGTYPVETVTFPGRNSASVGPVVVTDAGPFADPSAIAAGVTTENFSLTAAPASSCSGDTTQLDFESDIASTADVTNSPGDVTLATPPDQQNTAGTSTGTQVGTSAAGWSGQTFTAGTNGPLVTADFPLFCSGCTSNPNLIVSIRATSGGLPTGADLATATIAGDNSGNVVTFIANFSSPATLTAGTQYALIVRTGTFPGGTGYFWIRSSPSTYAGGQRVLSGDSGGTWSADATRDFNFHTYIKPNFTGSGDLTSSLKDANPAPGFVADWPTFTWTATTPANTSIKFQLAGSNSQFGPFNFVGPDGTAATFYTTSGVGSTSPVHGKRYVRYKAYLATTDPTVTPTLSDVTLCFNNNIFTAAQASLGGRVMTANGAGIGNAKVTISGGSLSQPIVTYTTTFGYYDFEGLRAGDTYVVTAEARRYVLVDPALVVNLGDNIADLNFIAAPR